MVDQWTFYLWPSCLMLGAMDGNKLSLLNVAIVAFSISVNVLLYVVVGLLFHTVVWLACRLAPKQ